MENCVQIKWELRLVFVFLLVVSFEYSSAQEFAIIKPAKWDKYKWQPEWNSYVAEEIRNNRDVFLNDDALPRSDVKQLCPGYFTAAENDKVAFWVLLVASIAYYESSYKPEARYQEPPSLGTVYSEGLLQLSYSDKLNHKDMSLYIDAGLKNINDPKANLQSGVKILSKQLRTKKVIFTSKSYYWSVLTTKKKEILGFFHKHSGSFSFCK